MAEKSYFQVARWQVTEPDLESFELVVSDGMAVHRINRGAGSSFQTDQAGGGKPAAVAEGRRWR
jgi:hypothetical protein